MERVRKESARNRCSGAGERNRFPKVSIDSTTLRRAAAIAAIALLAIFATDALLHAVYAVQAARRGWGQ